MKRRFLSLILFAYIAMQISYAQDNYQSFAKQWDEIKLHIKNNSYKQASDVANDIFVKSVEQDNQFEILRSFLSYLDCRRRVDWNENDILRDSLFKMSHLFTHPDVRILYEYSKLRNLFLSTSSGSGVRSDYLTLPVSQWNISEHVKSFKSLFGQILSDCDNFSHTPVKPYLAIFEKRDNSQYYEECSLGDYIKYCLIRTYRNNTTISATIDSLYASVLDQHVDNPELYIPMFVDFKKYDAPQTYYSDVDQIVAKYSAHPYVALAIADKLEMKSKDFFDKNNESHYQQIWDECNKTIAKYPDSKAVEKLEKIKETISRSYARFTIYPQYQPDTDCLFSVNHKNIDQFNLKVYRLNNPEKIDRYNTPLHVHSIDTYIEDATLVYSKKYKVSSPLNINKVEEFKFKGNKYGEYIAVFTDRDGICSGVDRFYVSDISAIFRTIDSKKQLYVADYTTGVPYSKVGLKITSNEKINSISRDENIDLDGFTTYMSAQQPAVLVDVRPYLDSDTYAAPNTISLSPISDTRAQDYRIVVNTDRRRYNFNDTIRLRAYVYTEGLDGAMLKGIKHSFKLLSGDGKLVYETPLLESDEWGGFDGYFIVSDAWMGGSYRIAVNREDRAFSWLYGSVVVNVDDFKKPKFDISLDNSVRVLKFGEKASIVGQISTFGGFDTQDIDVRYEISNRELRENIIAKGEVRSDKDGKFVIEFDVEPSKKLAQTIKFYNVSVTATDKQGETHSQSNYRIITNYPYTIDFDFPNFFAKEDGIQPKIKIVNQTSSKDCETSGTYTILKGDKPLISGQFESEQPLDVDWSVLMSGEYEFKASVEGAVDKVSKFVVFSLYDKTYPADYDLFVYQKESEFGADTPIEFVLGTKAKKLHAVVELLAPSGETLFAENMIFEKGMDCYQLPYKDSYPQSVHLYISAIYNGQSFVFNREYKRNAIDRNLNVTFISLRDKREPKEREEFIVKVTDSDGAAVRANILLTAYNLASDAPYTHTLSGPVNFANNLRKIEYDRSANSRLNIFGNANSQLFSTSEYITINGSTNSNAPLHYMVGGGTPQSENSNVREDFRSTVAFMSDLTTDENGEAKVSFTYPDAITTYKIIALAVAKDTRSSIKEAEVVVSRDVMISALLPQFFRVGDVVNVKAEVINKTSSPISGSVNFSAKGAAIISGGVQKVELAANSTSLIEFSIAANGVEGSIELTKEFIVGNHKDIEINKIPVSQGVGEKIENRKFIIDSKSKKIKFDLLDLVGSQSSDKSSEELVVAVANPIDMLLTSMAGVVQEESKSVLITLNNWYVSGVGSQMAYQYRDRINALHDENINSGNNQRSFGSRDEISTPWKTLSSLEITQRLSELSRPGQVVQEQQHRVERIIAMQNKDGGFPWYSSMPSSTMVTMLMLDKHSQLVELGHYDGIESYDGATLEMFNKAVAYIDNYARLEMNDAKKRELLSSTLLNYLCVRSSYLNTIELDERSSQSWDYYINRIKQQWNNYSIINKVLIATTLNRLGEDVNPIINSIMEYAVKDKESGGIYFPNAVMPLRGLYHTEIRAHAMILNLLSEAPKVDKQTTKDIVKWMLHQRHNQQWNSVFATSDAVASLWNYSNKEGVGQNTKYDLSSNNGGDYTKTATGEYHFDVNSLRENNFNYTLTASASESLPLYVEVNYSYNQQLSSVKSHRGDIELERKIYRVDGVNRELIDENTKLKVGDGIVVCYDIINPTTRSFVELRALRTGALQPNVNNSGYTLGRYREVKSDEIVYYFYQLPEGHTTIEENFTVWFEGSYSDGYATIGSLFNPSGKSNSCSGVLVVAD